MLFLIPAFYNEYMHILAFIHMLSLLLTDINSLQPNAVDTSALALLLAFTSLTTARVRIRMSRTKSSSVKAAPSVSPRAAGSLAKQRGKLNWLGRECYDVKLHFLD